MNMRRTWAVTRKELLHIVRDPRSLSIALAIPLFMIILFGYALSLDVDRIPAMIYDADGSPQSRDLVSQFQGSRYFQIIGFARDYRAIERKLDSGECLMGVIIPNDYARDLLSGREAGIQLILDGSDSNTASIALGYADALVSLYGARLRAEILNQGRGGQASAPIDGRIRVWYDSELKSRNYIVPGLIAVVLMIISALLTSLTIAREWESGTMEQLLSTPVRAQELVLGKMTAFFFLGIVDTVLALVAGVFVFEVPLRGGLLLLGATSGVFLMGALCWGILLSAVARSQLLAYQMGMVNMRLGEAAAVSMLFLPLLVGLILVVTSLLQRRAH